VARLPVSPYVLGAWLGDGTTSCARLACADAEIVAHVEAAGQRLTRERVSPAKCPSYWMRGAQPMLRALGVLGRKRIPIGYLRASEPQRRALLAGLLDTDGTVNLDGSVGLDLTSRELAKDARELIRSLGYRATMSRRQVRGATTASSTCYRIRFVAADPVFRLERKAMLHKSVWSAMRRHRNMTRTVVAVDPVPSVPVRCVAVDHPSHLYLAGEGFVPTHNTAFALELAVRLAEEGHEVEYVTLEDPKEAIAARLLARMTGMSVFGVRTALAQGMDLSDAQDRIETLPLHVTEVLGCREAAVIGAAAATTAKVVFVDYIQKIAFDDETSEKRTISIGRIMSRCSSIARRDEKCLLVLSQLKQEMDVQRRPPQMSDFADSAEIGRQCRQAWSVYWPAKHAKAGENMDQRDYTVRLLKVAEGPTYPVPLKWDPKSGRFWAKGEELNDANTGW
jgi:replicative DNA helicase